MENKKTVLITGCSSGIGYLTALTFARRGYATFASVRNAHGEGAKSLQEHAHEEKLDLQVIAVDVTESENVKKGIASMRRESERIDVLVNNAGIMYEGPIESFSIDEIRTQFETNYFGAIRMIKEILPIMRQQKSGRIVNISSMSGFLSFPLYGIYSSSKFALETMTEALRFEVSPFGIWVVLIEPGIMSTSLWNKNIYPAGMNHTNSPYSKLTAFLESFDRKLQRMQTSFIGQMIDPQRVADAIYKVCQEENPRLRHIVGYDAKLLYLLRRLLPERLWFWGLHRVYKW